MLAGYAASQIVKRLSAGLGDNGRLVLGGTVIISASILAVTGFTRLLPILNPSTVLARTADIPAMTWITENIPASETIAINPFLWGYGYCAGSDGGYWITPLTGHLTNPPPLLYGMGEAADVFSVEAFCQALLPPNASDPANVWDTLTSKDIHYVYIGSRGGPISAQALSQSPLFQVLFEQGGTWVFRTVPR
jgi:hypothetical protein